MNKNFLAAFVAFAILSFPGVTPVMAEEKIPDIEGWDLILGSCEKVNLNDDFQSGLKRYYYLDPTHQLGVGAISWVFYKDGSEHLYFGGWMLHTKKAQTAHLLDDNTWYVTPPRRMPYGMGYYAAMRTFFEKAKGVTDGKLLLKKTVNYVIDENGQRMMDKTKTLYFEKNSANDPNPQ